MNNNTKIIYIWTKDRLRLQGVHYEPRNKHICVLCIHGMSGNFIENYFTSVLGEILSENDFGFIYGHNRGYNHINDISIKEVGNDGGYKTIRLGTTYECFSDCVYDIDAWLKQCHKYKYKKIILLGHSLGCNKALYYLHKKKLKNVAGLILASPPDIVALAKLPKYQSKLNYNKLIKEARINIKNKKPRKLLSTMLWDWYNISSQTFLDLFKDGGSADNLPILKNPKEFPELASIKIPILAIAGQYDDIVIRTLKKDLNLIESKAKNAPSFTKKIIKGANHNYSRREKEFANTVLTWIKSI